MSRVAGFASDTVAGSYGRRGSESMSGLVKLALGSWLSARACGREGFKVVELQI